MIDEGRDSQMRKRKKRTKVLIAVCAAVVVLAILLPLGLSMYIYQANFGLRFEISPEHMQKVEDFPGLERTRYTFPSNRGQTLVGYEYSKGDQAPRGLIVMAHGFGGGGHNSYMDVADRFASHGYAVFAYDATGNDESEGDAVGGMPQGVMDLDYALRFVKENGEFRNLPILLFGHSWGAYSAGSVLNLHPDVKAAVLGAGFNRSLDMIEEEGRRQAGAGIDLVLPFAGLIERVKFGEYAGLTCLDGFAATDGGIMVIHSADDAMVSFDQYVAVETSHFRNGKNTDGSERTGCHREYFTMGNIGTKLCVCG